jgi:phospholipid-binding lipoprotein MlaA
VRPVRSGLVAAWLALLAVGCATPQNPDPWEPMNRGIFAFNETLDKYAMEPVAKGWDFVVPDIAQTGIENFFDNLRMPVVFLNDVLQLKPKAAGWDLMRVLYNTTFGLGGLIDIATMVDMPRNDEDFGQTLGYWGVPPGPFLMVPILGPHTIRSGTGAIADAFTQPHGWFIPIWGSVIMVGTDLLNWRAIYLEEIAESRADAFDYYVFIRNAYLQNRRAKVADQTDAPVIDEEDLYFFDDEEDDNYDDDDLDEEYDDIELDEAEASPDTADEPAESDGAVEQPGEDERMDEAGLDETAAEEEPDGFE